MAGKIQKEKEEKENGKKRKKKKGKKDGKSREADIKRRVRGGRMRGKG